MTAKKFTTYFFAFLFVVAGSLHFFIPGFYLRIMPPYLPFPTFLIYLSGMVEILWGLMLLKPKTRLWSAYLIVTMLIAFMPVHIYMVQTKGITADAPYWLALARLPLQVLMIVGVWWIRK